MNYTEETNGLAELMKKMEEADKTTDIKPQVCNMGDEDCLSCSG